MEKTPLDDIFKSRSHIAEWGADLERQACMQMENQKRYNIIIEDVANIFKQIYKGHVDVVMYGSRVTGLAIKDTSDIDLFIDTSGSDGMKVNCPVSENWLLNKALDYSKKKYGNKWTDVYAILTCRTPVLKMHHLETNLHCDITVMSKLGVCNTKMMALYVKNTPYLRQMILAAREWLIYLNMTLDLHNYTISLLVLFYLQIEKYAVSVNDLKFECQHFEPDAVGYETVDFESINYNNLNVKDISSTNLYKLLIGFFEYYSLFDFENDVVCPLLGHPIKKKLFDKNVKKLPAEMHDYVENSKKGNCYLFKTDMPMCVQDPLDLSHNLIKVVRKSFTTTFQDNCLYTANLLKSLS